MLCVFVSTRDLFSLALSLTLPGAKTKTNTLRFHSLARPAVDAMREDILRMYVLYVVYGAGSNTVQVVPCFYRSVTRVLVLYQPALAPLGCFWATGHVAPHQGTTEMPLGNNGGEMAIPCHNKQYLPTLCTRSRSR